MRSITLPPHLTNYLCSADYLGHDLRKILSKPLDEAGSQHGVLLSLDDATAERFREMFTERLAKAGFRGDYGLSPEGELLEDLIDRFAR